jgi:hypothetical protein
MRLLYNPKRLGDAPQAWKSFLTGALAGSSLITIATTENVFACLISLALLAVCLVLFIRTNMNFDKATFLAQNLLFTGIGFVVSLVINVFGDLLLFYGLVFIFVLVTWLHGYVTPEKKPKENETGKKAENEKTADKEKK